jgi:hypothetical protein
MILPESKFKFYEKVRISSAAPAKAKVIGELGAVLGMAQGEDGRWSYAVSIYSTGISWSCWENELVPTGEFDRRETFYSGDSVQVAVDKKGRGRIVGRRSNKKPPK